MFLSINARTVTRPGRRGLPSRPSDRLVSPADAHPRGELGQTRVQPPYRVGELVAIFVCIKSRREAETRSGFAAGALGTRCRSARNTKPPTSPRPAKLLLKAGWHRTGRHRARGG